MRALKNFFSGSISVNDDDGSRDQSRLTTFLSAMKSVEGLRKLGCFTPTEIAFVAQFHQSMGAGFGEVLPELAKQIQSETLAAPKPAIACREHMVRISRRIYMNELYLDVCAQHDIMWPLVRPYDVNQFVELKAKTTKPGFTRGLFFGAKAEMDVMTDKIILMALGKWAGARFSDARDDGWFHAFLFQMNEVQPTYKRRFKEFATALEKSADPENALNELNEFESCITSLALELIATPLGSAVEPKFLRKFCGDLNLGLSETGMRQFMSFAQDMYFAMVGNILGQISNDEIDKTFFAVAHSHTGITPELFKKSVAFLLEKPENSLKTNVGFRSLVNNLILIFYSEFDLRLDYTLEHSWDKVDEMLKRRLNDVLDAAKASQDSK